MTSRNASTIIGAITVENIEFPSGRIVTVAGDVVEIEQMIQILLFASRQINRIQFSFE